MRRGDEQGNILRDRQTMQSQWERWHGLQVQIKGLERLVANGDEFLEQDRILLDGLRAEEENARKKFARLLDQLK